MTTIERLLANVLVNPVTDCWEWTASGSKGYGTIRVAGKKRLAHRISYELHSGPLKNGMHVCHRCDNPACINPEHLFLGTQADNIGDMVSKGRQARGSKVKGVKLSDHDVLAIRAASGGWGINTRLAKQFGVSGQQIADIRSGKYWSHTSAPMPADAAGAPMEGEQAR